MQCKKIIHLFSFYIDGELMIEEEDRIEKHLDGCPQCRSEYTKLRNMMNLMGQLPQEDPGDEFSRAVMRRIRTHDGKTPLEESLPWRERLAQWFRLPAAPRPVFGMAATLVLGVVVGAGIYQILGGNFTGTPDRTPAGVIAKSEAPAMVPAGNTEDSMNRAIDEGALATMQPVDSLSNNGPEFVLDPYVMEDELRQVAVPLYPRDVINVRGVLSKDDTITF